MQMPTLVISNPPGNSFLARLLPFTQEETQVQKV